MNQGDRTGRFVLSSVAGEKFNVTMPNPLPPDSPPVLDDEHYALMEQPNSAGGRLDCVTALLFDAALFIYFYIRNSRWQKYAGLPPTKNLDTIQAEIDRDPTGIFWG